MASADLTGDELFAPGAILNGKYRLGRELGRGGMGQVFAATNMLLEAPVAIKVLHAGAKPSRALANRFLQEARAAAQVRHPNIVSVLDIGQDEATGALFIVQEFLQGRDLKRHIAQFGAMAPRDALELLMPVMRALSFAHGKGVVHRDLKPDNIFLCDTPEGIVPKIIDFGIAKMTDAQGVSAQMTHTAQMLGTPYYMSPEQARGDRAVDHRADVWSLGVVLYHMLTRRHPHEGATANLIITHIIAQPPTPVTVYAPTLPASVVGLVDAALRYDAAMRTPSMDAFWEATRGCLVALGTTPEALPSRPSIAKIEAAQPHAPALPSPADGPTIAPQVMGTAQEAPQRSNRAVVAMGLLAFCLVGVAGGYASTRHRSASGAAATLVGSTQPRGLPPSSAPPRGLPPSPSQPPSASTVPVVNSAPTPPSTGPSSAVVVPPVAPAPTRRTSPPAPVESPRGSAPPATIVAPAVREPRRDTHGRRPERPVPASPHIDATPTTPAPSTATPAPNFAY